MEAKALPRRNSPPPSSSRRSRREISDLNPPAEALGKLEAPPQEEFVEAFPPQQVVVEALLPTAKNTALQALQRENLICERYLVQGYADLSNLLPGNSSTEKCMLAACVTCPCANLCGQLRFFQVDPGCVRVGQSGDGTDLFFGPGVHLFCGLGYTFGPTHRVAENIPIVQGTRAIITVEQGYVGLALDRGEPILLPPGLHQWDDPNMNFQKYIDLSSKLIEMGPYTLVTVEDCYAAITQDNGKQKVLAGGSSYMLTHQNWKFQTWLSLKMQTNKIGPMQITTGDNISLNITANVNWLITNAEIAARRNVDVSLGDDSLKLMRDDVNLQVTSSLASLIGRIHYGSQGTSGMQKASQEGVVAADHSAAEGGDNGGVAAVAIEPEPEMSKLTRKDLWDPEYLQSAVNDANNICNRYGVDILSINLISASPADPELVQVMSRGAVATVAAEETIKAARAEANARLITAQMQAARAQAEADALLISTRSEAEALTISVQGEAARAQSAADAMLVKARAEGEAVEVKARAHAEAEKIQAHGSKEAGLLLGESEVATTLAKLKIAYGPFTDNQSSTFFFGLQGPSELPTALLGNHLAAQTGTAGLALSPIQVGAANKSKE